MKRISILTVLFHLFYFATAQVSKDTASDASNFDRSATYDTGMAAKVDMQKYSRLQRERRFTEYVDSINSYRDNNPLPDFLVNPCFDTRSGLWECMHCPISARWKILKNVTNKEALKLIINKNNPRLSKKCNYNPGPGYPSLEIPVIEKSTAELLVLRYNQLNSLVGK
jgi:hypothetical protein